ncbi:unnamed protein product [Amoebophrya sp. A25]|nr:unnamed protein product [Amoebophrya sp. A25]|eukprot:GSA25T00011702001.1
MFFDLGGPLRRDAFVGNSPGRMKTSFMAASSSSSSSAPNDWRGFRRRTGTNIGTTGTSTSSSATTGAGSVFVGGDNTPPPHGHHGGPRDHSGGTSKRPAEYSTVEMRELFGSPNAEGANKRRRFEMPDHVVQELSDRYEVPSGIVSSILESSHVEEGIKALGQVQECLQRRPRKRQLRDVEEEERQHAFNISPTGAYRDQDDRGGMFSSQERGAGGLLSSSHADSLSSSGGLPENSAWVAPETLEGWAQEFLLAFETASDESDKRQRAMKLLTEFAKRSEVAQRYEKLREANQVLYKAVGNLNERLHTQRQSYEQREETSRQKQERFAELEEELRKARQQNDILRYHLHLKG